MKGTKEYFAIPQSSLTRIYNCCDFESFRKNNQEFLALNKNLNLGMVARLEKHKDQSTLIKANPLILKEGIEVKLSIIGDGSKRDKLEKLSQEIRIKK